MNLCRGCLKQEKKVKFKSILSSENLTEKIFQLTGIKLTPSSSPALLCPDCILNLNRSILFRDSFIRSNEHFTETLGDDFEDETPVDISELNTLHMSVIKEEPMEYIDDDFECPRCGHKEKSEIEYLRHLNTFHLDDDQKPTKVKKNLKEKEREVPRKFTKASEDLRYDNIGHLIEVIKKRRRCQGTKCASTVGTQCGKCDVGLCVKCFGKFHTKN